MIHTDKKHVAYTAKCYRTDILKRQIEIDVEKMIYSLLGKKKIECRLVPISHFMDKDIEKYKYLDVKRLYLVKCDNYYAEGRSKGEALCKFLGLMLDGLWYPMT